MRFSFVPHVVSMIEQFYWLRFVSITTNGAAEDIKQCLLFSQFLTCFVDLLCFFCLSQSITFFFLLKYLGIVVRK